MKEFCYLSGVPEGNTWSPIPLLSLALYSNNSLSMPILYALISREKTVLVEHAATSSEFIWILNSCLVLSKLSRPQHLWSSSFFENEDIVFEIMRTYFFLVFQILRTHCSLFYSAITATGNFPTVTRVLLSKIPKNDGKMTCTWTRYHMTHIKQSLHHSTWPPCIS